VISRSRGLRIALLVGALFAAGLAAEHGRSFMPLRFAIQRDPALMPSTRLLPATEVVSGLPVVSLYVPPHDLSDPATGILAGPNRLRHGRDWERAGTVSYFDGGRLRFSAGVGVRVHGGGTRITLPEPGFRLFFRRRYGAQEIPRGVIFDPPHDHPLDRLILHTDVRVDQGLRWHLVNPLAYDIASALGGIVPATKPARMFLNGRFLGVYVLTEHFHERDYFQTHWGRPVRLDADEFDALWKQISALPSPRMANVSELVDLENMTRWFIATLFCATFDPYQGPGQYRDPARATAQWFWVNWDMDWSFRDWSHDTFSGLTERIRERRRGRRASEPRAYLFTRLLAEDPEYRAFFQRLWVDALNHRITSAFLRERFEHYRGIALQYGVRDLEYVQRVETFIERRPAFIRALAEQWLDTPPSVRCRVLGNRGIEVDGVAVAAGFEGYYFPGMRVALDVPAAARARFSHWRINGSVVRSRTTTVTADRDLDIEAVWTAGSP
jgi:hypothetical protein